MVTPIDAGQVHDILSAAQRVLLFCHKNPDGDAVGSLLGMGRLVMAAYPGKPVEFHCHDAPPESFHFLPGVTLIRPDAEARPGDALIFLDSAEPKLTEYHETHPEFFNATYPTIVIDHHPTNSLYGTLNIIVPEAASASEIVAALADTLEWPLDADTATCLLTGVYTDTGGLLHSNTTADVYRTVARLLRAGARQQEIVTQVFRTSKLSTLKLWGRVLEKISLSSEGGAVSAVTAGDFRATGADYSELTGAIDYLNAVPGMRFSLILSERDGKVKGSIRTLRDDVDVSKMAARFSGGGHRKAAGFALSGKLQPEVRWKVIPDDTAHDES